MLSDSKNNNENNNENKNKNSNKNKNKHKNSNNKLATSGTSSVKEPSPRISPQRLKAEIPHFDVSDDRVVDHVAEVQAALLAEKGAART